LLGGHGQKQTKKSTSEKGGKREETSPRSSTRVYSRTGSDTSHSLLDILQNMKEKEEQTKTR